MSETTHAEKRFIGYEYKEVAVPRDLRQTYADAYENFGWTLVDTGFSIGKPGAVAMKFKRDRKITNKAELTRLERQFEACTSDVQSLERSKVVPASTAAYIIGLVATALMGGAVFAFLGGLIPLMILLAVPGFAGWALSYFVYTRIVRSKTAKVTPLIETKYDEMYTVCEKANGLAARA